MSSMKSLLLRSLPHCSFTSGSLKPEDESAAGGGDAGGRAVVLLVHLLILPLFVAQDAAILLCLLFLLLRFLLKLFAFLLLFCCCFLLGFLLFLFLLLLFLFSSGFFFLWLDTGTGVFSLCCQNGVAGVAGASASRSASASSWEAKEDGVLLRDDDEGQASAGSKVRLRSGRVLGTRTCSRSYSSAARRSTFLYLREAKRELETTHLLSFFVSSAALRSLLSLHAAAPSLGRQRFLVLPGVFMYVCGRVAALSSHLELVGVVGEVREE
ncbi:hypothetical protein EYF80_003486 [Liparis tanakae]|uniref:Uncharacterized protein n=1 Tax=Liparis tanakae TaxID=230148 RepID=A0A4Z2J7A2_9TELE|nr:hypothetical protein EYF80_003486 [Liparis tanakae]